MHAAMRTLSAQEHRDEVLEYIRHSRAVTRSEIAAATRSPWRRVAQLLDTLVEEGAVTQTTSGKRRLYGVGVPEQQLAALRVLRNEVGALELLRQSCAAAMTVTDMMNFSGRGEKTIRRWFRAFEAAGWVSRLAGRGLWHGHSDLVPAAARGLQTVGRWRP